MKHTNRKSNTIRKALATAALAAAITAPVAVATATPAIAAAGSCSPLICGTTGNHNETVGRDRRRRTRTALGALALAAAISGPAAVATASPASAAGGSCSPLICGSTGNHNETVVRDRRRSRLGIAYSGLALAAAALPGSDAVLARIAVNHNESVGVDATP